MPSKHICLLLLLACSLTSCISKYVLTDKELAKHFKTTVAQPQYNTLTTNIGTMHYVQLTHNNSNNTTQPLILFVHGAPGAWYGYLDYLEDSLLATKATLISIDRPGYGKSGTKVEVSIQKQATLIAGLIANIKQGRKVVLVGRSYGSPICARIAMDNPQLVDGMLLIASAIDPDLEKFWWFSNLGKWKVVRLLLPKLLNKATDEKFAHVAQLRAMDSLWNKITIPTIVVQGGNDNIVNPKNLEYAKRKLTGTNAQFVYEPNFTHFITSQQPQFVKLLIINQLLPNINIIH